MNILMITVEYPPDTWGGIATATELMSQGFKQLGHSVTVLTSSNQSRYFLGKHGERIQTLSCGNFGDEHPIYHAYDRVEASRALSTHMFELIKDRLKSFDFIICHSVELHSFCQRVRGLYNRKIAYFCHGLHVQEHFLESELIEEQRLAVASCDFGLVATLAMKNQCVNLFRSTNFIHLPLPLNLLLSNRPKKMRQRSPKLELLAAGRAVWQKGFAELIEGLASADARDVQLNIIIGHGNAAYIERCKALSAHHPSLEVHFHSWMNRSMVLDQMRAAHAVVVPSHFEPLGLVAVEAISQRTAVWAANVGGLPEVLGPAHSIPFLEWTEGRLDDGSIRKGLVVLKSNEIVTNSVSETIEHINAHYSLYHFARESEACLCCIKES